MNSDLNRVVLLDIGDGPDGVIVFTDEQRAIVDNVASDSLYVEVSTFSSHSVFGPMLPGVTRALKELYGRQG